MKLLKTIMTTICVVLAASILPSCSNDSPDEPDNPKNQNKEGLIEAKILPGIWQIESIVNKNTGKSIESNRTFNISDFKVTKSSNIVPVTGGEAWAYNYKNIVSVETINGLDFSDSILGFIKFNSDNINSSYIYSFLLNLKSYNEETTEILVCDDLSYRNNILTANASSYGTVSSNGINEQTDVFIIKFKKLQ